MLFTCVGCNKPQVFTIVTANNEHWCLDCNNKQDKLIPLIALEVSTQAAIEETEAELKATATTTDSRRTHLAGMLEAYRDCLYAIQFCKRQINAER